MASPYRLYSHKRELSQRLAKMINSYSIKKKLTVSNIAQNIGVKMTHLRTGIPLSNIYRWMVKLGDYSTIRNPYRIRRVGYKELPSYL